jgi:predicted enzyme related to lactoylglutathione lyase
VGEVSSYPAGAFCWVDLGTPDIDGARRFYPGLLGWEVEDVADGTYTLCTLEGKTVTGMHEHPEEGAAPHWDSYVAVSDVDATVSRARELGAEVTLEPMEVPGAARMAAIRDPSGAPVSLWQALGHPGAALVNETGTWTWNDLLTRDPDGAEGFYGQLLGWRTERVADIYASFTMGDLLIGGMRTISPEEPTPAMWVPYFVVADGDAAVSRVQELGGRVLVPSTAVPAGRFLMMADPAGAVSALFEMGPGGPARGVDAQFRPPG